MGDEFLLFIIWMIPVFICCALGRLCYENGKNSKSEYNKFKPEIWLKEKKLGKYRKKSKWNEIEEINKNFNLNRENTYIDEYGYLRYKTHNRLCHRDIAYQWIYCKSKTPWNDKFGNMVIHHKDKNKLNNNIENLEILKEDEHNKVHKVVIEFEGEMYHKLCNKGKIRRETTKGFLVGRTWFPKSQSIESEGYIYIRDWLYKKISKNKRRL